MTIINDVLDFSKIEAGKLDLESIEFAPRELLDYVVRMMRVSAEAKGLALKAEVADSVPALVRGDAGRLRQILVNLCGNAIKFTERGGVTVVVTAAAAATRHDAAPGSARHRRRHSCESRAHAVPAVLAGRCIDDSPLRGTGLGLSIVRRLAELMGGEAGVESREGVGSTFWFTARFDVVSARISAVEPVPARVEEPRGAGKRILLAEDNVVNEKVATRFLQKLGYVVDAWARGGYGLVLMDCQMPVLDGYAAAREIRARERTGEHIPIVALTADAMPKDELECRQAGMDDHLAKPIDREELARCLEHHLRAAAAA